MNFSVSAFSSRRRCLAGVFVLSIAAAGCSHFGKGHHDANGGHDAGGHRDAHGMHGDHAGRSALALNDGAKWSTDAPLRTAMRKIRMTVETETRSQNPASIDPASAMKIATEVEDQVGFMIEHCELEPKADATLHVLISDMLKGAGELRKPATSTAGLTRIQDALEQYPEYFSDAQW